MVQFLRNLVTVGKWVISTNEDFYFEIKEKENLFMCVYPSVMKS